MNEKAEPRACVISIPGILWTIRKSWLESEKESEVFYFFKSFWKLRLFNDKNEVFFGKDMIKIHLVLHSASENYPKIRFSLVCGWLRKNWCDDNLYPRTTEASLEDLITQNKNSIQIWQNSLVNTLNIKEFPDDTLRFICRIQLQQGNLKRFTELIEEQCPIFSPSCVSTLTEDLGKFLDTSAMTDVILKCGDTSFPAHKFMLSCRSSVFQAMFQNDFRERARSVVDILDIEPPVLKQLLKYVYTGNIDTTEESVEYFCNLFKAADKYCIESLKERCVRHIIEELEPRHACEVLLMSSLYKHRDLKAYVVSFLANRKEFLQSEDWQEFANDNPTLALEVFFFYIRKDL